MPRMRAMRAAWVGITGGACVAVLVVAGLLAARPIDSGPASQAALAVIPASAIPPITAAPVVTQIERVSAADWVVLSMPSLDVPTPAQRESQPRSRPPTRLGWFHLYCGNVAVAVAEMPHAEIPCGFDGPGNPIWGVWVWKET
jgi:hypothetical protein